MIWVTVSSRSCFCWLYRASPSLEEKNMMNLILVFTIWWCPCVESSIVLLEEGVCCYQCILLAKLYWLLPYFICTPGTNLPITPGISWFPTFALQSPIMKRISFFEVVKQEMARMNMEVLGISELKWTGMSEFKSDDHFIYYCGKNPLEEME